MSDAGRNWEVGLSSLGQGISQALQEFQARQDKVNQSDALMQELSQTQKPDGKPYIDAKTYQDYLNHSQTQRAAIAGAKIGAMKIVQAGQQAYDASQKSQAQTLIEQAKARIVSKAADEPFFELRGQVGRNTPTGAVLGGVGTGSGQADLNAQKEARIAANQTAGLALKRRKEIGSIFKNEGYSPEDFNPENLAPGTFDSDGKFVPVQQGQQPNAIAIKQGDDPSKYPAFGLDEANKYVSLNQEYNKLGQVAFSGLTGGKQTAPVQVTSPDQARALPSGTLYQRPGDTKIYRIP
jgi:hypothetical protein